MRYVLIDKFLTENSEAPLETLLSILRVSLPTLKRDLRFMREELGAPIKYSRRRNVYYYDAPDQSKPHVGRPSKQLDSHPKLMSRVWYTSDELYVLVNTVQRLSELRTRRNLVTNEALAPLRARVKMLFNVIGKFQPQEFLRRVRILDSATPHREAEDVFAAIGCALCENRMIRMRYFSASRSQTTLREVSPQRLVHYDNRWYFDAYCETAGALRTFAVENVRSVEVLEQDGRRVSIEEIEQKLDGGYGIYHGNDIQEAVLGIDKKVAPYVMRHQWHERQRVSLEHSGSLRLTIPYAHEHEIVHDILRWGGDIEVRSPASLREAVAKEARRVLERCVALDAGVSEDVSKFGENA